MIRSSEYSKCILTADAELHKKDNANFERDNIHDKVAQIVRADTVVNPRTVTGRVSSEEIGILGGLAHTGHA